MPGQKERLPECIGYPGRETARDQQPTDDVEPDRSPIHHEIVADGCATSIGCHPLPKRAALGDGHIHFGVAIRPAMPLSDCFLACSRSSRLRNMRKRSTSKTTMSGAPKNSASVNCQPRSATMMMVSSRTRLVEAISNAIAAVKCAPLRKIDRASATAA